MHLTIPPLTLSIDGLTETEIPWNSWKFLTEGEVADIHYTFHFVKELPQQEEGWELTFERPDIQVFQQGEWKPGNWQWEAWGQVTPFIKRRVKTK